MKNFVSKDKKELIVPIKPPIPEPKPEPKSEPKKYEVVLATKNYVVYIDNSGTNSFKNGDFSNLKPGDMVAF